mgnify:CR=1 FL=1
MKTIEISYNPYKMITRMLIDKVDVCKMNSYDKFKEFIQNQIPLQTWIEPIPYLGWEGFVNETSDPEINDEVTIIFSGRKIDFDDLKRSIADQNEERAENTRVTYHFEHKKILDDKILSQSIEEVVKEIKSERFCELVSLRTTDGLIEKYRDLDDNYTIAKESEFYIVFAGVYSSGKSTLINTLIRHDILPTSGSTCTSKNCRIRHDSSLGSKVSLCCYDEENNIVIEKRIFDNDVDCATAFVEISPMKKNGIKEKYPNVHMMELGADLSHLYPASVSEDKFTIVLIDTPGVDSAKSIEGGCNKHAELALNAISMDSKPMIILCADATKYEDKSIGEFMMQILLECAQDGSGFNDRFLFLMNKSDSYQYRSEESIEEVKTAFAEYLTDSSKWNITVDENDVMILAKGAARFVPRVFMTSALMAWAINDGAGYYSKDILKRDKFRRMVHDQLKSFKDNVTCYDEDSFMLSLHCDIPGYLKDEISSEFHNALDNNDAYKATELQCGVIAVELAIRDYIERYAYPIKVRGLLETFEDIIEDVNGFTTGILSDLKKKKLKLGEKESERKEENERKGCVEGKIDALKKAKVETANQLAVLDGVRFDSVALKRAITDFQVEIEAADAITFIRRNPKVKTGQKTHDEVLAEISNLVTRIKSVFDATFKKTNDELERIKADHDKQILCIYGCLRTIVANLERSGIFDYGEYRFTDSVTWKKNFANIDSQKFTEDLRRKVVDRSSRDIPNYKKREWQNSWNPLKKIGALFMSDTLGTEKIDGYYETGALCKSIDSYYFELNRESENMQENFENMINESKEKVKEMTNRLLHELDQFMHDIKVQEERLGLISKDIDVLNTEIAKSEEIHIWLTKLKNKIKGE